MALAVLMTSAMKQIFRLPSKIANAVQNHLRERRIRQIVKRLEY